MSGECARDEKLEHGQEVKNHGKQTALADKEFFIGSVSERVVRYAKGCAVWIVE